MVISTPVFAISPPTSPDVSHQEAARQHQPADRVMAKSKGVVRRGLRCIFVYSWLLFKIVWWKYPSQRGLQGTFFTKLADFAAFGETTPSRRPSKAHRSPNDLGQRYSGPFWPPPVFPMCHIRKKNGLSRTFSSWCVTSGRDQNSKCQQKMSGRAWGNVFWHGLDASRVWPYPNPYWKRFFVKFSAVKLCKFGRF